MISGIKNLWPLIKKLSSFIYNNREEIKKYVTIIVDLYSDIAKTAKQRQMAKQK